MNEASAIVWDVVLAINYVPVKVFPRWNGYEHIRDGASGHRSTNAGCRGSRAGNHRRPGHPERLARRILPTLLDRFRVTNLAKHVRLLQRSRTANRTAGSSVIEIRKPSF